MSFYNATTNDLYATAREGSLDAAFVLDALDAWAAPRTRPTVLVPDNAKIHHAAASACNTLSNSRPDIALEAV
ncbi:hypothetical protein GCM10022408_26260 [Hymenobacter fastidiosus]|uniref:Tc1-like transposase DDE domain-containing protein n=1 Tax=Hymenobacter fastidiosus TaxID=486264 RepID=A0ABP7SJ26_9BACT